MENDIKDHVSHEIEKLAQMIKESFDAIDRRFEELETRMDKRFDRIETRLSGYGYRIESLERDVAILKT